MQCEKGDIDANLARHVEKLVAAASQGCELVLFPEMSLTGSVDPSRNPERLISLEDSRIAELALAAKESDVAAAFGVAEISNKGEAFITQVVVSDGRRQGVQRKRHLGVGEEHFSLATGTEIFDVRGHQFAIAICAEGSVGCPVENLHLIRTGVRNLLENRKIEQTAGIIEYARGDLNRHGAGLRIVGIGGDKRRRGLRACWRRRR